MENEQKFSGWRMLFSIGIIYLLVLGFAQYGGSVTAPNVLRDIPMSRAMFGLGFTLLNLFVGINSAFVAAPLVKKIGIRNTAMFGCGMLVVVAILMQIVTQPWQYLLVFGVLVSVVMTCGTIVPYSTWIARWFAKYRGRAMGYMMVIASFGGTVASPVLGRILSTNNGNWRMAWVYIGVIGVVGIIANRLLVKETPQSIGQLPDGIDPSDKKMVQGSKSLLSSYDWTAKEAYKTRSFWMIFVSGIAIFAPFFFFVSHYILHLTSNGFDLETGAMAMGIMTLGGVVGRLLSGFLTEKIQARFVLAMGVSPTIIGALLAVNASTTSQALIGAALFGMGFGWPYTAMLTTLANFYGVKVYPQVMGTMMLLTAIICSPSGMIGGLIYDSQGSYTLVFNAIWIICLVGGVFALFAKMPEPSVSKEVTERSWNLI
ncbi:MFS transporter [Alkalibacter mobilis]|uniref:MFS transporter n=1 Tax=Alkalibacter mobilis TaxID=2787712 RepID=UPI00189EF713|nr:MFS transporter [Alkalibacter mobilis]MBF7097415.1 MFS transporter [Alkalibacter mobilis]